MIRGGLTAEEHRWKLIRSVGEKYPLEIGGADDLEGLRLFLRWICSARFLVNTGVSSLVRR